MKKDITMECYKLSDNLSSSKTKYIRNLFESDDMRIDSIESNYISIVYDTYLSFSYDLCKRISKHLIKNFLIQSSIKVIYIGPWYFLV